MKKILILFIIPFLLVSCRKNDDPVDPNNLPNNNNQGGIFFKGRIDHSNKSGDSLTLADASKILVFSKYYHRFADIVNDTFSVGVDFRSGVALIFLDSAYRYIGQLSSQGLNVFPLGNLSNGENTVIDLQDLSLIGNTVVPSHDPLGSEIIITPEEINCLEAVGAYYESIAKNIDANNDSVADIISHTELIITNIFARFSGYWGHNDTVPVLLDTANAFMNYSLEIDGGSALSFSNGNIVLTGPEGDPYPAITTWGYMMYPQCGDPYGFISSFCITANAPPNAPWGTAFLPFRQGTYTLLLDGTNSFTLDYSNIDAKYNLIIISPTLHTDSAGKLTSLTFEFKLPDGSDIDPKNILTEVMVQMVDSQMNQFYNSPHLTAENGYYSINFDTPLDISSLFQIDIWYHDLLGNSYDIIWR